MSILICFRRNWTFGNGLAFVFEKLPQALLIVQRGLEFATQGFGSQQGVKVFIFNRLERSAKLPGFGIQPTPPLFGSGQGGMCVDIFTLLSL